MSVYTIQGNDNSLPLDLASIQSGTVTKSTAHNVVVDASDGTTLTFHGNFTGGGGGFPTGGTIDGWTSVSASGTSHVGGVDFPVAKFNDFLSHNNADGLEHAIFRGADTFDLSASDGTAHVYGHGGNDVFMLGATYASDTAVMGGTGYDTVALNGDYKAQFSAAAFASVEELRLHGGHNYSLTENDANVAAGRTFTVDASDLQSGDVFEFDGTDERDGNFVFHLGNHAATTIAGGLGNDRFFGGGSSANLSGGDGNDHFSFGGGLSTAAVIDGGTGHNTVALDGDYSAGLVLGAATFTGIQSLELDRGHSYHLTLNADNAALGDSFSVHARSVGAKDTVSVDGSAIAGNLTLKGGAGGDTLIGGTGHNVFLGGGGVDAIDANGGHNVFKYHAAAESTGRQFDTIAGLNGNTDHFNLDVGVDKIDTAVTSGKLTDAHFNTDLADAVGAGQLGAHDAVLFTASAGAHAGETFLVVDTNGTAGYQANHDLVIQLDSATHLGALTVDSFV